MQEEFIKEILIVEKSESEQEKELLDNITKAKKDLDIARKNYEYADSTDLVDYYIYQIKANQAKINYLIKLAKIKGIFFTGEHNGF